MALVHNPTALVTTLSRKIGFEPTFKLSWRSDKKDPKLTKVPTHVLGFVLRNLSTMVGAGISLTKSLNTLAQERMLEKYQHMFQAIRRDIESGNSFSAGLANFPRTFDEVMVNQVRAGERAGTLPETLDQIAGQLEQKSKLRTEIIRKLSYPTILLVAGTAAVTFLLTFVVPLFQKTYEDIGAPLPYITQFLILVSRVARTIAWPLLVLVGSLPFFYRWCRKNAAASLRIDQILLRLPLLGNWLRNIIVYQFIEVFGNLLQSGFTVVEALKVSARTVRNQELKQCVLDMHSAVTRGERLSVELDRHGELFPAVVSQLIVVAEKTGKLHHAATVIRDHLRREIERYTVVMVGSIEPILTISLAAVIAVVLLAIYLPMFDMIGASHGR